MGMLGTSLKWKLGMGKKELGVILFLLNGRVDFFSKIIDNTGCITVESSKGERKVIISNLKESIDSEMVKNIVDFEKVNEWEEQIEIRENLKEELPEDNAENIEKLKKNIDIEVEKTYDCVGVPTNSFLENKQKLVVLVEGKAGNIHPMDLVKESDPNLEDIEINNALMAHLDLGRDLERRQVKGLPLMDKVNLGIVIFILLGIGVLIWLSITEINLLTLMAEEGIKVASAGGGSIVPKV